MKFGLIGKTLKHSYSKIIHEKFSRYTYDLVSMEEEEIPEFVKKSEYAGFNVTIPYKKTIIPFCTDISDEAKKIGSVNTVVKKDGGVFGYNTDYAGFSALARFADIKFSGKKVAVLGSGGTYNTAFAVVKDEGAKEIISVSRSGEYNYENIESWKDCEILINTTPVGMYPDNGKCIVDIDDFVNLEGVIDVIYNPLKTKLVHDAEKKGIKAIGGLYMLIFQAKEAFEIFTGEKISEEETERIYNELMSETENIVFIGMPGSGKSTAGRMCKEIFGKELLDIDEMIEEKEGMPIPEIFEKYGEEYFRNSETECIEEAGKQTGKIISCGGGVVKKKENLYPLSQNGRIIRIKRDLKLLATNGRPLSKNMEALVLMEKEREPMYEEFSDITIENNGSESELLEKLKTVIGR